MKKAILVSGLFSLVMVLTSFTSSETSNNANSDNTTLSSDLTGGSALGGNKKVDLTGGSALGGNKKVDLTGGSALGGNKKVD